MNINTISPYIRLATHSVIPSVHTIRRRVLYDFEIIYVKDGKCRINIDGTDYICRKNDVVFLPPGVPHSFHTYEDIEFNQPHIHFDAVFSDKSSITPISFSDKCDMTINEISLIQENIFSDLKIPYIFVPENSDEFQKTFFHIINSFSENNTMTLYSKGKLIELISLIVNQFNDLQQTENSITTSVNIKNYIDGNFLNIITLDSLSDIFHINKFTMMRNFKKDFNTNIIEYYNKKRADYAKHLLLTTNMTVKAVGDILNFTDSYSFSRFFKNQTGISPLNFRK